MILELAGHSTLSVTALYMHWAPSALCEAEYSTIEPRIEAKAIVTMNASLADAI